MTARRHLIGVSLPFPGKIVDLESWDQNMTLVTFFIHTFCKAPRDVFLSKCFIITTSLGILANYLALQKEHSKLC